jgi:EAL domain-containing protein (putative c-di-GMP-specific phosphodiesterase class I)
MGSASRNTGGSMAVVDSARMARGLRGAVTRGEIAAWFQPQVDVRSQRIVGAEALCRWLHPSWGMVPPTDFIPVAEEHCLIEEIGEFMASEAISAMQTWKIDVSVNVSPAQLENAMFTGWLGRMIQRVPRAARRLTIEITEGLPLADVPALVARLDRLRGLKVGIAIDDVGAGQASLTQAKRLHATELKLDRGLIADDSPATDALIADTVDSAHDAGLRVVAEGIETVDQLEKVSRLGCDRAQGYLIGRPVRRPELARLLVAG